METAVLVADVQAALNKLPPVADGEALRIEMASGTHQMTYQDRITVAAMVLAAADYREHQTGDQSNGTADSETAQADEQV